MKTLKIGSAGEEVKILQRKLNLLADGIFGKLTEEAVKDFQREHNLVADGIVGEKTWTAINGEFCDAVIEKTTRRKITDIVVHCSATEEGKDYTVGQIRSWHKAQGYSDIGYHFVIYRDGSVHTGRDVNISGAHVENHNSHSIGICYIGGCPLGNTKAAKDTRTPAQKAALRKLLRTLSLQYPQAKICGHRDFPGVKKACPSFDAKTEYANL